MRLKILCAVTVALLGLSALPAAAAAPCPADFGKLQQALKGAVKPTGGPSNGGLDNNEWAALVTREGSVCAVTFSGEKPTDQWLGSRSIAAEKANTANALSLAKSALSTANLYAGSLPGGYLFGLWRSLEGTICLTSKRQSPIGGNQSDQPDSRTATHCRNGVVVTENWVKIQRFASLS